MLSPNCTGRSADRWPGLFGARGVAEVDDVVNSVFLAVFTGLDRFSGDESSFRAWVFGITRNKVSDWFRSRSRDQLRVDAACRASVVSSHDFDESDRIVTDLETQELLATLTPDQRDIVLLRVVADLSAQQTADLLGKSLSAVKALQRRAIRRLRMNIFSEVVSK